MTAVSSTTKLVWSDESSFIRNFTCTVLPLWASRLCENCVYVALVPTLVKVRSVVVTPFTTICTRKVSYAVEPDSAVSVRIQ